MENIINETVQNLFDKIYPVGSVYISTNGVNPSVIFGGEWTQLKDKFLLASGDNYTNGATGGEATHTLSIAEMPKHSHIERLTDSSGPNQNTNQWRKLADGGTNNGGYLAASWKSTGLGDFVYTYSTGDDAAHNNMPPYLVVNMWERIG